MRSKSWSSLTDWHLIKLLSSNNTFNSTSENMNQYCLKNHMCNADSKQASLIVSLKDRRGVDVKGSVIKKSACHFDFLSHRHFMLAELPPVLKLKKDIPYYFYIIIFFLFFFCKCAFHSMQVVRLSKRHQSMLGLSIHFSPKWTSEK